MKRDVQMHPAWPLILKALGIGQQDVLQGAGLEADLLRGEARVTATEYLRFWESIAATSGDPMIAIRLGKVLASDRRHPQIRSALATGNVALGLAEIAAAKSKTTPIRFTLGEQGGAFAVDVMWNNDPRVKIPAVLAATELVFVTEFARLGHGRRVVPAQVESPYALVPPAPYENYFGVTPMLSNEHRITLSLEDARAPFPIVPPEQALEPDSLNTRSSSL